MHRPSKALLHIILTSLLPLFCMLLMFPCVNGSEITQLLLTAPKNLRIRTRCLDLAEDLPNRSNSSDEQLHC
jgi:hypothetical protein